MGIQYPTYTNVELSFTELACLWCVKLVNFNLQYVGFVSIPFEEHAVKLPYFLS